MEEIEVTWNHAALIWWSLFWRVTLFGMLAGFVVGLFAGMIAGALGQPDSAEPWARIGGLIVSIPVGISVVKLVLTKQFRDYRIALVPSTEVLLQRAIEKNTA
jgi:hypothetical protein